MDVTMGADTKTQVDSGREASEGSDGGVVIPSCKNPTTTATQCATCLEGSCAATASTAVSACATFYSCYAACDCSDATCIQTCVSAAPTSCTSTIGPLETCQSSMCAAACTPPDAGSTGDAGSSGGCKNPTPATTACGSCTESHCASALSTSETTCTSFYTCFATCNCTDTSCIEGCAAADTQNGCSTALTSLNTCQTTSCASACAPSTGDGGTAGQVPDCANPSSAQQTAYATCSACDHTSCPSQVSTAVSACNSYYTCFAGCACGDTFCELACPGNTAGSACNTAIVALTECQNTNCLASCP